MCSRINLQALSPHSPPPLPLINFTDFPEICSVVFANTVYLFTVENTDLQQCNYYNLQLSCRLPNKPYTSLLRWFCRFNFLPPPGPCFLHLEKEMGGGYLLCSQIKFRFTLLWCIRNLNIVRIVISPFTANYNNY